MIKLKKAIFMLLLAVLTALIAGLYGSLHNQISYSISEEYFTKYKFIQFELLDEGVEYKDVDKGFYTKSRLFVAIVGFLATWWVGFIGGLLLATVNLWQANPHKMFSTTLKAVVLALVIALLTGLLGVVIGKLFLSASSPNWKLPANVIDRQNFVTAGAMHNFSYIGALIGLLIGVVYSVRIIKRENMSLTNSPSS